MKELIKKLVETASPSGYEKVVRDVIMDLVKPFADEISVDALGSLIVRKGKKASGGSTVMLAAHMDEIGVIVTYVDDHGFARFVGIGGVRPITCVGSRVKFINGASGVISMEKMEIPTNIPAFEHLYIDLGSASRETCPVKVGDVGVFDRPFVDLGDRLVSKAMDDRIGVAVLIESLKTLPVSPHEIYYVFSTQEEVGLRGATTSAYAIAPDVGLSVDVTGAGDTPKCAKLAMMLGKGAAIKVRDGGMLSDPRLVQWMVATAEKAGIAYQMEVLEGGTTDAYAMQLSRAGVPVSCISIPTRYIHSPSEMLDYNDVLSAVKLLNAILAAPIVLA